MVLAGFILFLFLFWYRDLFWATEVTKPLQWLVLVDVIIGPLLTLLVYKKGKKSLKFDLSVIVLVQICAFVYGAHSIYQGKPSLVVFNYDGFELVSENEAGSRVPYAYQSGLFSTPQLAQVPFMKASSYNNAYEMIGHVIPFEASDWNSIDNQQISMDQVVSLTQFSSAEIVTKIEKAGFDVKDTLFFRLIRDGYLKVLAVSATSHQFIKVFNPSL